MMLFPAVLMNSPNSEVCLIGEWSIGHINEVVVWRGSNLHRLLLVMIKRATMCINYQQRIKRRIYMWADRTAK